MRATDFTLEPYTVHLILTGPNGVQYGPAMDGAPRRAAADTLARHYAEHRDAPYAVIERCTGKVKSAFN